MEALPWNSAKHYCTPLTSIHLHLLYMYIKHILYISYRSCRTQHGLPTLTLSQNDYCKAMSSPALWQKVFRHPLGSFVKSMCSNWSTPSRDCEVSARLGVAVWRPLTDGGEALFVCTDLTSQFSSSWCRASRTFFSSSWPAGKVWCFQSIQPSAIFLNQVTLPRPFFSISHVAELSGYLVVSDSTYGPKRLCPAWNFLQGKCPAKICKSLKVSHTKPSATKK